MEEFHALQKDSILDTIFMKSEMVCESERFLQVTLAYPKSRSLKFQPGDHIKIFPENDPQNVQEIIKRIYLDFNIDEIQIWKGKYTQKFCRCSQQKIFLSTHYSKREA